MNAKNTPHPLEIYFQHNLWANLLLFDRCLDLDPDQLNYSSEGSFGSIKSTLMHIVSAEENYIFHITSRKQMADSDRPSEETTLAELRQRAEIAGGILLDLATSLDGEEIVHVKGVDFSEMIPIKALYLQVIHHAHEHRTQVESMLGQLRIDPPGLSGWRYYDEQIKDQ